jgi:hypothetical protein
VFDGNVRDSLTVQVMLDTPNGALVIMNAGIATETNIDRLIENDYKHPVVSRCRKRDWKNKRLGRLKQRFQRVAQHDRIEITVDKKRIPLRQCIGILSLHPIVNKLIRAFTH